MKAVSGKRFCRLLENRVWELKRVNGSHHIFSKTAKTTRISVPVRGVGAIWLVVTALAFQSGALITGYILGGALTGIAALVSTTDICIPSMIYNALFLRSKTT